MTLLWKSSRIKVEEITILIMYNTGSSGDDDDEELGIIPLQTQMIKNDENGGIISSTSELFTSQFLKNFSS